MPKPIYGLWPACQQTGRRVTSSPILLPSLLGLMLSFPSLSMAIDSDRDGLSDEVEQQLGYDPNFFDSNTDGITDFNDAKTRNLVDEQGHLLQSQASSNTQESFPSLAPVAAEFVLETVSFLSDEDGDTVDDFHEAYGYFYSDFAFFGVKRKIETTEWQAFKDSLHPLPNAGIENPFQLASLTIENNGWITDVNGYHELHLADARASLIEAFTIAYGATHALLTSYSGYNGSLNNIVAQLSGYALIEPTDSNGNPIPYYFTDASRYSSDFDPYSDAEEVSKVNASPLVKTPADHPLVSGYPVIEAHLKGYNITRKAQIRNMDGGEISSSWSNTSKTDNSTTDGWESSLSVGVESGLTGPKYSMDLTFGLSGSSTHSTSESSTNSGSDAAKWSLTEITERECAGYITLNYLFKNSGTAPAYDIVPRISMYIGNTLTFSYLVNAQDDQIGDLMPNETTESLIPFVGSEICISFDQLKQVEMGAPVRTLVEIDQAKIAFFNDATELVETKGNWSDYIVRAEASASKLRLKTQTTSGAAIDESYLVYAGGRPQLSIADALNITKDKKDCPEQVGNGFCLGHSLQDTIVINEDTHVGILGVDENGTPLTNAAAAIAVNELVGEVDSFLQMPLQPRWQYNFVTPESDIPKFIYTDVATEGNDFIFRAAVTDIFGLDTVWFCPTANDDDCVEMADVNASDEITLPPTVSLYSYTMPFGSEFTGNEKLRALNTRGFLAEVSTSNFFDNTTTQIIIDLDEYKSDLLNKEQQALSYFDSVFQSLYEQALADGHIADISAKLDAIRDQLLLIEAALDLCNNIDGQFVNMTQCIAEGLPVIDYVQDNNIEVVPVDDIPFFSAVKTQAMFYYIAL